MQDQKKQPNTVSEEDEVSSSSKEEMPATEVAQALRQDPTNLCRGREIQFFEQ